MSISELQMRIEASRNEMAARIQQAKNGSSGFNTILQEKMSGKAMANQTISTDIKPQSVAAEINIQSTISGEEMSPLTEVQAFNYTQSAAQTALGTAGYGAFGAGAAINGYNAQCPQCVAQGAAQGTGGSYGNMTTASSGLSARDLEKAAPYMQHVNEASQRYGMPVNLILGIMKAESDFNNSCVSYAGAKGLMQLMPETAAEVGVTDEFDPRQNILGSVEYVTKLINRYNGDVRLALAAYNTGPGKIARRGVASSTSDAYLTVPQSIRDYAERVLKYAGFVG